MPYHLATSPDSLILSPPHPFRANHLRPVTVRVFIKIVERYGTKAQNGKGFVTIQV